MAAQEPRSGSRFGDACGVAAFVVTVIGTFFPARPGMGTESWAWFLIAVVCAMAVLGAAGLRYGTAVGKFTGLTALVFAGFVLFAVRMNSVR